HAAGSTVEVSSLPPAVGPPRSAYEELQAWILAQLAAGVDQATLEAAIEAYLTENPPSGGGSTTVQIGTLTLPASPAQGQSVSVLADSTTVLPEDVTWDSGGEPTITERMLLMFVWSGADWVGTYGPSIPNAPEPVDETDPTAGTLGVVPGVTTADLSVSGASDDIALHGTPYAFSTDNGSTWSAY